MAQYEVNICDSHDRNETNLEDAMKLLDKTISRLESTDSRTVVGDKKLSEMITQAGTDNLNINLTVGDTSAKDKSKHASAV